MFEIAGAAGGQRVAAVHKSVDEHAVNAVLFSHLQQRIKMCDVRVHAAVGDKSEDVQAAASGAGVLHGGEQDRVPEELAILDHQVDACNVHMNDAARANVEMADLAVAHLAVRQADVFPAGVNQGVWIFAQQAVVIRLTRQCNRIGFGFGAVTPAVEDDKDKRFGTGHLAKSSCSSFSRSMFR